jgi:trans-2,3-dihydro-3-hydroxyanthranilate isomerase
MQIDFVTVDVFTQRRFGGNPLAVVRDGSGLDGALMQSIAAEFNLAETTFVLSPRERAHTAAVRIFTPRAEVPFAGHPNIGTAFVLAALGGGEAADAPLLFEEKAGLVRLDLLREGAAIVGARLAAPQPLDRRGEVAPDVVAAACGLGADDVETINHRPCIASCGIPFVFAELKTRGALSAARPQSDVFSKHVTAELATGILLYVRGQDAGVDIEARMFAPLYGIPEDPATGSANLALAGLLADLRGESDLRLDLRIVQGVDMGRESMLEATAEKRGGRVTGLWIGGRCVPMMRGTLEL